MRTAILSGVLFLSGCAALLFETLWLRLSGLVFGNSVWSAALILSSFMGGLALGNGIAAWMRLRPARPLRLYAALEVAIAVFGGIVVFLLPQLGHLFRPIFHLLWNHDGILNLLRLTLSFLILLAPTTAMGLTLPVVLDEAGLRRQQFGRAMGFLYGWNTLGAVAGALLGESLLVPALGLFGTAVVAALANITAAVIALGLSQRDEPIVAAEPTVGRAANDEEPPLPERLLLLCAATGALLLCLEVVWFRFLRLYVAASSTAFAVMLAAVLAGIGAGGVVAGLIHRHRRPSRHLVPFLLLLAALVTLLSYLFFPGPFLARKAQAIYLDHWSEIALLSLALMFPTAFISGILFPTIAGWVQASLPDRVHSAGLVTVFNTVGAAIGPWLAAFILLPLIGYQGGLIFCAIAYAVLSLLVTERVNWTPRSLPGRTMIALGVFLLLLVALFPFRRNQLHFASARAPFEQEGEHLVRKIEGTADTYQLLRADHLGEPYYYRLLTNAFSMSASAPHSQRYMRLFAYLPLALKPQPNDALLICYGLGVTADALRRDARLQHIDIVDTAKEAFTLAENRVGADYPNPLRDPRVQTFVQDGRFFLQATPRQYDIITGEPPPPKVIGAVNLYTEEFFRLMKSRLKDGGVASFWLPIYQMRVEEVKSILRAFHNVFDNASVWAGPDDEWIMIGINGSPTAVDTNMLRDWWINDETASDLIRIGIEVPEQLAALFVMDGGEIDRITTGIKPLRDAYPKRLSDVPSDLNAIHDFASPYMEAAPAGRRFRASSLVQTLWPIDFRTGVDPFLVVREERYLSTFQQPDRFAELEFFLRRTRLRAPVLEIFGTNDFQVAIAEKIAGTSPSPPVETLPDLTASALARRDYTRALELYEKRRAAGTTNMEDLYLMVYLYCLGGNVSKAEALAVTDPQAANPDPGRVEFWRKLQAEFGFRPPR